MLLEVNDYKKLLKDKYSKTNHDWNKRYLHSLSVGKKAVEIVKTFNFDCDLKKIEIAGILHDYAKFEPMEKFIEIVDEYKLNKSILDENPKLLHAFLGPYIINKELGITDEEILTAIKYHATGSINMSRFTEVIYVSDVAEDLREGKGFDLVKHYSKTDFKKAILEKINFSLRQNNTVLNRQLLKKYSEV